MPKTDNIKIQALFAREKIRVTIFSKDIVLFISTAIALMLFNNVIDVMAQAPYLNAKTDPVTMGNNTTASVFCNDGDGMISGGYSTGFSSVQSAFDTIVYSNHPIQEINQTGYFEGWEAGLVNRGNTTAEITAIVLCLNLTLTP
jgi:hypothetical protein